MVGPLEELPLLGDGVHDRFKRRTAVGDAEGAGVDFGDDL